MVLNKLSTVVIAERKQKRIRSLCPATSAPLTIKEKEHQSVLEKKTNSLKECFICPLMIYY